MLSLEKIYQLIVLLLMMPLLVYGQNEEAETSNPFRVGVTYTGDIFGNVDGGQDIGFRYLDNIDIDLLVDFGDFDKGPEGLSVYLYGLGNQGGSISSLAGDIQGISNIETENSWRIYEFWAQKKFYTLRSSLLLGLYDVNTEFNALNSSQLFINSSHGIDPTIAFSGILGPSIFPYTSLGLRLKINPYKGWVLKGAVLDGIPSDPTNTRGTKVFFREQDGVFLIGEIGYHSVKQERASNQRIRLRHMLEPGVESDNTIAFGGWYYSEERLTWGNTGYKENELGLYVLGEYELISQNKESGSSLKVFSRLGVVNPDINVLNAFVGGGFVAGGLLPGRPGDQTGLAVAHAATSSSYVNSTTIAGEKPEQAETNIEFTHKFVLNDYVQIQGNVQYIINPGFNATLDNALVVGTRLIMGL